MWRFLKEEPVDIDVTDLLRRYQMRIGQLEGEVILLQAQLAATGKDNGDDE